MSCRLKMPEPMVHLAIFAVLAVHIGVLAAGRWRAEASNLVQLTAALLVVWICLLRAQQASDRYFRSAWLQLTAGFAIYTAAQTYFVWALIWNHAPPRYPSAADCLWMLFAFPILLVTVKRRSGSGWQWVDWLDAAQACTFFFLLYVLVFSHPAGISVSLAYELQSTALILAWAIRYSGTQRGRERRFFYDIGLFLITYGVLSSIGNRWEQYDLPNHGWVGLCWSVPLLYFSALVLRRSADVPQQEEPDGPQRLNLARHLHGVGALGLSGMSIAVAATLALHRSRPGVVALTIGFLLFAVRTCIREAQLHIAHGSLEHSVLHDALTGLANRAQLIRALDERLGASVERQDLALLFIDLDRFKVINDSFGHEFGDRILIRVARMIRSDVRACDLVVRLAGDEFVVLLSNVSAQTAAEMAANVVSRFQKPIELGDRVLHVTVSVGYVMNRPGVCASDLLRDADCAMYAAKKQGKNQAQSFHDGVMDTSERNLRLESDLRKGLAADELTVHYQPIYSLPTRRISGFEALVRWNRPDHDLFYPGQFIPIAEETGLIVELGKQVLQRACIQIQKWNETFEESFTLHVNVSARQLEAPDLLNDIRTILDETKMPPALLKLEITETVLLSACDSVTEALRGVRDLGIGLSLDDFLTGYSSLSYLLQYPCDSVKIDKSFVHDLDKDLRRAELVRTVVQLASNLEMDVIAEGVETEDELLRLRELGCNLIQGFLVSRALPACQVEALLGRVVHPMRAALEATLIPPALHYQQ